MDPKLSTVYAMRYPIALGQFEAVQVSKGSIAQGHMRGQMTQLGGVSSFLSVCRALDRYRFGFRIDFAISSPLHEVSRILCTIGQYDGTGWAKENGVDSEATCLRLSLDWCCLSPATAY
jgi:hypothetical protein